MNTRLLLVGLVAVWSGASAQEQPAAPALDPPPPPPAATERAAPDIESFRQPGSTAALFPAATPAPDPADSEAGPRRKRGVLGEGGRSRSNRSHDVLVDKAGNDPLKIRVAYRRAKTAALGRDPGLLHLQREANNAHDDVQKRALLKEYYTRLYATVLKIDSSPGMKAHVDVLTRVASQRYDPKRRAVGDDDAILRGGGGRGRRGR